MKDEVMFGWLILISLGIIISWLIPFARDYLKELRGKME